MRWRVGIARAGHRAGYIALALARRPARALLFGARHFFPRLLEQPKWPRVQEKFVIWCADAKGASVGDALTKACDLKRAPTKALTSPLCCEVLDLFW